MKLSTALCLLLALFFTHSTDAQPLFSGWLASFNTIKTGKRTSIALDVQLRSTDDVQQVQTLLIRPGLSVHINKHFTATAGYGFIDNKRTIGNIHGFATEHRLWEQLLINHKIKRVMLTHRFRLEQRFIPKVVVTGNELERDGSVNAQRFRYFVRGILPFNSKPVFEKGLFAALQNEFFINFGNIAAANGESFDQNRLYLAIGYRLSRLVDLETGYLNQYVNGRNKAFTNNHVVQLAGYLRL